MSLAVYRIIQLIIIIIYLVMHVKRKGAMNSEKKLIRLQHARYIWGIYISHVYIHIGYIIHGNHDTLAKHMTRL